MGLPFAPSVLFVIIPTHQARQSGLLRSCVYCLPLCSVTFDPLGSLTICNHKQPDTKYLEIPSGELGED